MSQKQGMNSNAAVPREILDLYNDISSWFWTYSLQPSPNTLEWGQENDKEFVSLINLKKVSTTNFWWVGGGWNTKMHGAEVFTVFFFFVFEFLKLKRKQTLGNLSTRPLLDHLLGFCKL